MVVINRRTRHRPPTTPLAAEPEGDARPPVSERSDEAASAVFDRRARELVGLSGDEFLRRYDRGDFTSIEVDEFGRRVVRLAMLIPFGRIPS